MNVVSFFHNIDDIFNLTSSNMIKRLEMCANGNLFHIKACANVG